MARVLASVSPVGPKLAALALAGLAAGIFAAGGGAGSKATQATSHVTVTATESRFTLSKSSVPTGTVIFTVINKGKISHDFKIAGKKTPLVSPGHSATLRVTFSKKGRYPYLSTVVGQASAGMKGVFSVVAPTPNPTTAPPPIGTASTTVTVGMVDTFVGSVPGAPTGGSFSVNPQEVSSGAVTFVITNNGCTPLCSFHLEGIKAGGDLKPGESETWTVKLPVGIYHYHCDFNPLGMTGTLFVTPKRREGFVAI